MAVSFKNDSRKPATFRCRSHPKFDQMESLLNKAKNWESTISSSNPSADIICSGFSHLKVLHECLEDLFNTNLSDRTTSPVLKTHPMKWADELLDVSVMFLDICYNASDIMSVTRQHVIGLGCDVKRNVGCSSDQSIVSKYIEFRNKMKKDVKRSMGRLIKDTDNMIRGCSLMVDSENYHLIRVFKEVASFSILIFEFLLEFLAIKPSKRTRTRGWTAVSRFLSNGKVVPADTTSGNELQLLDAALLRYSSTDKHDFLQVVLKNIEALEDTVEGINSHINSMSRSMIATRASILNMISFY
ncbi:hypothetical protein R6Q59_035343 [Mikania micrantha]